MGIEPCLCGALDCVKCRGSEAYAPLEPVGWYVYRATEAHPGHVAGAWYYGPEDRPDWHEYCGVPWSDDWPSEGEAQREGAHVAWVELAIQDEEDERGRLEAMAEDHWDAMRDLYFND